MCVCVCVHSVFPLLLESGKLKEIFKEKKIISCQQTSSLKGKLGGWGGREREKNGRWWNVLKAQIAWQRSVLIWIKNIFGFFILYNPIETCYKSTAN